MKRYSRHICLLLIVFILFAINAHAGEDGFKGLSLAQAIKRALSNNPSILFRKALIDAAKKEKQAQWGAHLPRIDVVGEAYRTRYPSAITPISGPGNFPHFSKDAYLYSLNLELPIYEGGRILKRVKVADLETSIRRSLERETAHDIIANIKNTFYLTLYLRALIKAQQEAINALKKEYKDAELRLKLQKIAPLDLLRIKTQLRAEEAALKASKESLRRAKQAIAVLMGDPPRDDFVVLGELSKKPFLPPKKVDEERFISFRPDIKAAEKRVEKALEGVSLAWREHLPSLNLFSSYGRKAGSGLHHDEDLWEIGLKLQFNIYSGGTISAEVEKARAELFSTQEELRQKRLSAKQQIEAAMSKLIETNAQIQRYKSARQTAKEAYRVESLRYKTGAGTVTDMLLSQSAWLNAEADYLYALYRNHKANIDYEYATGTIGMPWLAQE